MDLLNDAINSQEFKTKANVTITWTKGDLSSTAFVESYGRTPNYLATVDGYHTEGADTLARLTLVTLSARYQMTPVFDLSLAVNNVFNTKPPVDHSYPGTAGSSALPVYNELNYSAFGRTYFLELNYNFGK